MASCSRIQKAEAGLQGRDVNPSIWRDWKVAIPLLATALNHSTFGFAIYDEHLRCAAANDTLAFMSGVPLSMHAGRKMRQILGNGVREVEADIRRTWITGERLSNVEFAIVLTKQHQKIDWAANFYPIKDAGGKVRLLAGVFSDITGKKKLRQRLCRLTDRVRNDALSGNSADLCGQTADMLRQSIKMLDDSMVLRCHLWEARLEATLLRVAPFLMAPQHEASLFHAGFTQPELKEAWPTRTESQLESGEPEASPSPRERQVVELLAEGKSNKQIAAVLELSTRTVEGYRARLMAKLNLHSVGELVRYAVRNSLVQA